jgi:hypothetical protein
LHSGEDVDWGGYWALDAGFMLTLQPLIKTKLDRKKLDKETTFIQHKDSAGVLLNGVNHIYGRIKLAKEQQQTNTDKLPEGVANVIDEVMEYEPEMLVLNLDDHIFPDDDEIVDETGNDKEELTSMNDAGTVGRTCLIDLVEEGWNKLREMNVKKVRMVADEQTRWKRRTTQYIMERVIAM